MGAISSLLAGPSKTESAAPASPFADCLPANFKLTDIVEAKTAGKAALTIEAKLRELHATCSEGNSLVDAAGRQIVFYRLIGCWGFPPPDYQEQMQRQRVQLEKLKQDKTVVEMTCNPSGTPIP